MDGQADRRTETGGEVGMKKDFIVRRSITMVEGKPHVETYSEQELVRCKDCKNVCMCDTSEILPGIPIYAKCSLTDKVHKPEWFCADGKGRDEDA